MKRISKILMTAFALSLAIPAFSAMTVGGNYKTTDSKVFMDLFIKEGGNVNGVRSDFLGVVNEGTLQLEDCVMTKEVVSHGTLMAHKTDFKKDLSLSGETELTSCRLTDIHVHGGRLILDGYTEVAGSIIFETGNGEVYKKSEVTLLGDVIGGTVLDLE